MKLEYANDGEFALVIEAGNPWNNDPDNRRGGGIQVPGYPYLVYHNRYIKNPKHYEWGGNLRGNVLDLGCGCDPFPWATTLINKDVSGHFPPPYLEKTRAERKGYTTYMTPDGRVLWLVDVSENKNILPFDDKEIDFVYASHVYEHLNNPVHAFQETIRCGKEGLIKGPDREWELLYTQFPFDDKRVTDVHQWYIEVEGDGLDTHAKLFVFRPSDGCHLCHYMLSDAQRASVLQPSDRLVFRQRTDEEREFTEKRMDRESVELAVKRFKKQKKRAPHRRDLRSVEELLAMTPEELITREYKILREYNEKLLPMYKNPSPTELHWHGTIKYEVRN